MVGEVEVELGDAVVQTVADSCTSKLEYPFPQRTLEKYEMTKKVLSF